MINGLNCQMPVRIGSPPLNQTTMNSETKYNKLVNTLLIVLTISSMTIALFKVLLMPELHTLYVLFPWILTIGAIFILVVLYGFLHFVFSLFRFITKK